MTTRIRLSRALTSVWWGSILLLALALPFELAAPWFSVGSLFVLTNLEVMIYATLLLWMLRQWALGHMPRWNTPLMIPIVGLLTVLALSSLFAPSENLHALKVTARWCTGAAVYFMIVNALNSGLALRRLLQASAVSGIVVALLALWEATGDSNVMALVAAFRQEASFQVGGQLRVSSTLAYTTIAAMYLEFIFFFVLGWLVSAWSQRHVVRAIILECALLVVAEAIILTLTRGALIAISGALVFVVLARWRQWRFDAFARAAVCAVLALAALLFASYVVNPMLALRLGSESDRGWFQARYTVAPLPPLHANETITVSVQLQNIGQHTWNARGAQPVHLFYHWLSADRSELRVVEGLRTALPRDIAPNETITLAARVRAPPQIGDYILGWDMVREDAFWFSVLGWPLYEMPVSILERMQSTGVVPAEKSGANIAGELHLERGVLWDAALRMVAAHPALGVGAGNFRLVLGNYLGFAVWDNRLHANNTYLEMFADSGLLGGAAFMLLMLMVLRHTTRVLAGTQSLELSLWLASVAAALVAFLTHGVVDYFLEFTSIYFMFWMTLGVLSALADPQRRNG